MPSLVQALLLTFAQAADLEEIKHFIETLAVQYIDTREGPFAAPNPVHLGVIACPPCIGKSFPIRLHAFAGPQFRQLPNDGRSPVNDRAKRVEHKSLDIVKAHTATLKLR